jgi:hypothetical protein
VTLSCGSNGQHITHNRHSNEGVWFLSSCKKSTARLCTPYKSDLSSYIPVRIITKERREERKRCGTPPRVKSTFLDIKWWSPERECVLYQSHTHRSAVYAAH